jgi:serine/threonine protein kinase
MLEANAVLQGRYQIVKQIGKGGMGAVYLARDLRLGSRIALKETFFSDEALLKAFEREARLLANLRHASLPRVSDHFTDGEGQFLVMEFIEGHDLAHLLEERHRAFPSEEVLNWADQLLDALDYLHTQEPPIIHRDIKPQNLKLTGRGQIVLLDFGLAKGQAGAMTRTGSNLSVFGYTPHYAPLEQIQGSGTDSRSDLYSLAATLYHLATNLQPADAMTRANAVLNHEDDPLAPACEVNPFVPPELSMALARAMSLKRSHRPANAAEMRASMRPSVASTNYITGRETAGVGENKTAVQETPSTFHHQGILESDDPMANTRPDKSLASQPTLADSVNRAQTASGFHYPDQPTKPTGLNWVTTFNRKWVVAAIALMIVAGGTALTLMTQQKMTTALPQPVDSPPEPALSTPPVADVSPAADDPHQNKNAPAAKDTEKPNAKKIQKNSNESSTVAAKQENSNESTKPGRKTRTGNKDSDDEVKRRRFPLLRRRLQNRN